MDEFADHLYTLHHLALLALLLASMTGAELSGLLRVTLQAVASARGSDNPPMKLIARPISVLHHAIVDRAGVNPELVAAARADVVAMRDWHRRRNGRDPYHDLRQRWLVVLDHLEAEARQPKRQPALSVALGDMGRRVDAAAKQKTERDQLIRTAARNGLSARHIARMVGVHHSTVSRILSRGNTTT